MRNVNRSRKHEDMVQRLAIQQHPVTKRSLFLTIRELMCFAAMLGYSKGRSEKLDRKVGVEDIAIQQFEVNDSIDFIYLIALAQQKNLDVLEEGNEDDAVTIFEEYANGGLEIIAEWMRSSPDDPYGDRACLIGLERDGYIARAKKEKEEKRNVSEVIF